MFDRVLNTSLTNVFSEISFPNRHLLTQSQQWKLQSNLRNLFKVNKKRPERRHRRRVDIFIVNFEYISHMGLVYPFLILNK